MCRLVFRSSASALALASMLVACGGGTVVVDRTPGDTELAAATSSVCVHPSTSAQTVALPNTGGVSGSLNLGAFSADSSQCIEVTLATGDAAQSASSARVAMARLQAAATSSRPILTLSLSDAFPGASQLNPLVVEGATLNAGDLSVFRDGTYYATITYGPGTGQQTVQFHASGGVLTLVNTGTQANPTVISVVPGSTAVISLFGEGVIPATPSPSPSPIPTPTPLPLPSQSSTPAPTASATTSPTLQPNATPTPMPSATPYAYNFSLHEGPFTSDCNCQFNGEMIKSVDVVASNGGNFTIDDELMDGTSITAAYFGSNLKASTNNGDPLYVQSGNDYDNFMSDASDVYSNACNDEASNCTTPVLYSVNSVQSQFDMQFAAYRKIWGF